MKNSQEVKEFLEWFHPFIEKVDAPYDSWEIGCKGDFYFVDTIDVKKNIIAAPIYIQKIIKIVLEQMHKEKRDINDYFYVLAQGLAHRMSIENMIKMNNDLMMI